MLIITQTALELGFLYALVAMALFLPVLRFAYSPTGRAQLRTPFGEPFGATTYQKLSPFTGKVARSAERGAAKNSRMPRVIPPQLRLRSAERWLEYGRLAALPLAILPIPPDSPLAASPTWRARLESPARGDSFCLALPKGFFSPSRSYCDGAAEKNSI